MKSSVNKTLLVTFLILGVVFGAYSQTPLDKLQNGVADFSNTLAKSLAFNSSIGLNWSDAYVGQLIPSLPPHFGVGVAVGATTLDMPSLTALTDIFDFDMPANPFIANKMILPAYAAEARIGGLFLPFDIGAKYGILPPMELLGSSYKLNYTMAGADIRWALLDGKSNLLLPNISLGVGANYLSGGIGAKLGGNTVLNFTDPGDNNHTLEVSQPDMKLLWETFGIEAKVQISKELLIFTPYAGIAGGYSWSKAGYDLQTTVTYDTNPLTPAEIETIKEYLTQAGLPDMNISETGISSIIKHEAWNVRAFGGLSLNILIFKLDLTAMYNILDGQLGAQVALRVQL